MINLIGKLLTACAGFSWTFWENTASVLFFGESKYPSDDN